MVRGMPIPQMPALGIVVHEPPMPSSRCDSPETPPCLSSVKPNPRLHFLPPSPEATAFCPQPPAGCHCWSPQVPLAAMGLPLGQVVKSPRCYYWPPCPPFICAAATPRCIHVVFLVGGIDLAGSRMEAGWKPSGSWLEAVCELAGGRRPCSWGSLSKV